MKTFVTVLGAITVLTAFESEVESAEIAVLTELLIESKISHAQSESK